MAVIAFEHEAQNGHATPSKQKYEAQNFYKIVVLILKNGYCTKIFYSLIFFRNPLWNSKMKILNKFIKTCILVG